MDESSLYTTIFKRKSVRKFERSPLDQGTLDMILSQARSLVNLVPGIRTEIRLMTSEEVRGMFKVDAPHFLAIYSEPKEGYLINAGFLLQHMDLFLSANGIGSCWQGGPKPSRGARSYSGLEFVILLAFGKPQEPLHRGSLSEFKRNPLAEITDTNGREELLEPARLAPSGMNNQPWFFARSDGVIHALYHKSMIADHMNQVSMGIALSHIWLASRHLKRSLEISIDPVSGSNEHKRYAYAATIRTG